MASFTCVLAFLGPCVTYICGLLVFSCMDTNNVAFKFSPYLLLFMNYLLSNLDFTLSSFFLLFPITLEGCGVSDDFATVSFHLVLFSAALVELTKSIPVHSLTLSFHLFFVLPLILFPFIVSVGLSLLNEKTFRRGKKPPSCLFLDQGQELNHIL